MTSPQDVEEHRHANGQFGTQPNSRPELALTDWDAAFGSVRTEDGALFAEPVRTHEDHLVEAQDAERIALRERHDARAPQGDDVLSLSSQVLQAHGIRAKAAATSQWWKNRRTVRAERHRTDVALARAQRHTCEREQAYVAAKVAEHVPNFHSGQAEFGRDPFMRLRDSAGNRIPLLPHALAELLDALDAVSITAPRRVAIERPEGTP